jgi:hypothetical protein
MFHVKARVCMRIQVLAPPYICSRTSVWLSTNYFLACIFLIKSKAGTRHHLEYVDAHDPDGTPENIAVSCLMEISMLYFSYGWLAPARHTVLWAILENEAGAAPPQGAPLSPTPRYELVGHFVDVSVGILQRSCVPDVHLVLGETIRWTLSMIRTAAPMPPLNPVFLQRLAKVLHCCMLRLPYPKQREMCGRAVLALQRLALMRFRGEFVQPVSAMPLPLVDCSTLTTVPVASEEASGTSNNELGLATWRDLSTVGMHRQSKCKNAELSLLQEWAMSGRDEVRSKPLGLVHNCSRNPITIWHVLSFDIVENPAKAETV